ncbi:MAG: class II aldolase/adducin family protein [Lactobacillus sp.]|jgi:L-fuculose-phosphate aldolase|nr:class II aldolase/adducin family protein [Lactobacillus sp.]
MQMMFYEERKDLAHTVQKTFDRLDTNIAGGNMSMKVLGNDGKSYILITPTFMSETYYAELSPAQILVVDEATHEKIDGVGDITREINMHFEAYSVHPGIRCVYHSHAEESMFWATSGLDMPNVTEATRELGKIKVLPYAPATSKALADIVRENLEKIGDKAMENVFLLNSHGILITATDLHIAARIMETLEWNARIAFQQSIFIKLGLLDTYKSCGQNADQPIPKDELFPIPLPGDPLKSQYEPFPKDPKRPADTMIPGEV